MGSPRLSPAHRRACHRRSGYTLEQMPGYNRWLRVLRAIPDPVWTPLVAGGLILGAGGLALLASQPWLFPSLGPTAFLQAEYPDHRTTRFRNTLVGHWLGAGCAFLSVLAFHAQRAPIATSHDLPAIRVWAAVLAVALTALTMLLLHASHAPAIATALVVALGGFDATVPEAAKLFAGIAIFAVACAGTRQVRMGTETPAEHAREEDRL